MKIRRLEVQGFKSFADRTVLKFGDGITGVVGPNGCGKSNIVDAIRWVMGEQSAKHLRGLGMQDIIFAGCETRGPAGMAEVSITFKNDGALVPPEYQHHEEIQVTRRLYRDGTSEYAINQVICRLRDILDLFMGTGIGKNAYAIIEQGRIGLIVTARPEERRALIEDAAGISRYKARRKQAERRIAATEQNLLRVTDLVTELQGRLRTLEGQAKKAEKYRRIKTELRDLDLHSSAHKLLEINACEHFESQRSNTLTSDISNEEAACDAEQQDLLQSSDVFQVDESNLRKREASAYEHEKSLDLARQNVAFLQKEEAKLQLQIEEAQEEQESLLTEKTKLQAEQQETETIENSLDASATEENRELEAREIALEALKEEIHTQSSHLDTDKSAMVEHLTAVAEQKNALKNMLRREEELTLRTEAATDDAAQARTRSDEARKQLDEHSQALVQQREGKFEQEQALTQADEERKRLKEALEVTESELDLTREKVVNHRSRLQSLQQIRANYEGCSDAVRSVMQRDQPGLHGLVADLFSSAPQFETAVEAVLGERLQSIVVADQQEGFDAGQFLRQGDLGRSTFIPMELRLDHAPWFTSELNHASLHPGAQPDSLPPATLNAPETERRPSSPSGAVIPTDSQSLTTKSDPSSSPEHGVGEWMEEEERFWPNMRDPMVCGRMVDLVSTKPGYEHVAQALVGDVVVVETLDKARELWENNGHKKTLVTLQGDVLDPTGIFTGGSSSGVSEGLLAQKREIEELAIAIETLDAQRVALEQQRAERQHQIEACNAKMDMLTTSIQESALAIVTWERDIASLRQQVNRELELAERADRDRSRLLEDVESLVQERTTTEETLNQLQETHSDTEVRVTKAAQELAELEAQARQMSDAITTLKVEVAAKKERRENSRNNLTRLSARLDDIDTRLDRIVSLIDRNRTELNEGRIKAETDQSRVLDLEKAVANERPTIEQLRKALEDRRIELKDRESSVQKRRAALDLVKTKLNKSDMKVREFQIARENLHNQIRDRYQIELNEILTEYHTLPRQDEAHQQQAKKLRRQLSDIGAINLTAIDEFASVKARYDHLSGQKIDLETAVDALKSAIRKINKTSQERFIEAFRLVNEKFQQVFPKVFNGGRSALVLTDESDPLESGIEIMAQPPGKKLQSVNLLSGGEKALTAVSLIFGIFLIKPTPFCLLDEVDAPLDEANVGRYNDMLREMAHISQFILITHNKRTMELPDRLYGVTMETPGVSKIVPVDVVADKTTNRNLRVV
ncbi:MAG: chromosome segregation protein SMC [Myxococcales bacterium]|nr:chromosome segregation protein SMC [Myxococcales bacterium]